MRWTWWELQALPEDVYAVLVDELNTEAQKQQTTS
jgi:hypothetical protein